MDKKNIFYLIFYSAFTAYWFISYMYAVSGINTTIVCNALLVIGIIAFALTWFSERYKLKEYIIQFLFLAFLIFCFWKSGKDNEGILTIWLALVGLRNIDIRKVTKVVFFTLLILFALLIIFTLLGIVPYTTYIKTDAFGIEYNMIKLANQHGNPTYIVIFNIVTLYMYAYYEKLNLKHCIFMQIVLIISYMLFSCRTGLILGTLAVWGVYFIKTILKERNLPKVLRRIIKILAENSYLIMFLFVYIVGVYLNQTSFFDFINKLVSSRIHEAYHYLTNVGMGLFPKEITYHYICDNLQTYIMVSLGLIFTILYLALHYIAIRNLIKNGKRIEVFFMIIYLLYSYCEVVFLKPFSNFSILFLIYAFYPNRKAEQESEKIKSSENMCD